MELGRACPQESQSMLALAKTGKDFFTSQRSNSRWEESDIDVSNVY